MSERRRCPGCGRPVAEPADCAEHAPAPGLCWADGTCESIPEMLNATIVHLRREMATALREIRGRLDLLIRSEARR